MATLQEIKDRIAIDKGFRNWNSLIPFTKAMYTDEVAKAYAKSVAEKVREDCANNATCHIGEDGYELYYEVEKQSILETPIELP